MTKLDAYERLRNAAILLATEKAQTGDAAVLFQAWEHLRGLRTEDFPAEIRAAFSFLEHEIARAKCEELSAREIAFLAGKICKLESMWTDSKRLTADTPV